MGKPSVGEFSPCFSPRALTFEKTKIWCREGFFDDPQPKALFSLSLSGSPKIRAPDKGLHVVTVGSDPRERECRMGRVEQRKKRSQHKVTLSRGPLIVLDGHMIF